jgi:hypothetical protein
VVADIKGSCDSSQTVTLLEWVEFFYPTVNVFPWFELQ